MEVLPVFGRRSVDLSREDGDGRSVFGMDEVGYAADVDATCGSTSSPEALGCGRKMITLLEMVLVAVVVVLFEKACSKGPEGEKGGELGIGVH